MCACSLRTRCRRYIFKNAIGRIGEFHQVSKADEYILVKKLTVKVADITGVDDIGHFKL